MPARGVDRDADYVGFLVVTFGASWLFGGLAALGNLDAVGLPSWIVGVGNIGFLAGPTVGAIAVRRRLRPGSLRATVEDLRRPAPCGWFAIALIGGAVGAGLVVLLLLATGGSAGDLGSGRDWATVPVILVGTTLAALLEELGWRGSLLPVFQARTDPRWSVVLVGIAWGVWHLPLLLTHEGVNSSVPVWAYPVLALGLSPILAWLYDAAGGSLLVPALAHGALNAAMAPVLAASFDRGHLLHLYAVAVPLSLVAGGFILARCTFDARVQAPLQRREQRQ